MSPSVRKISKISRLRSFLPAVVVLALFVCGAVSSQAVAAEARLLASQEPVDLSRPGPWLVFDISMGRGMGTSYKNISGAQFLVQIADASEPDAEFKTLWRAEYDRLNAWLPQALDLSGYAGRKVRIRLMTEQIDRYICQDYPYWGDPRVVVGPLAGEQEPEVLERLSLTYPDRMGGILDDGTVVTLDEEGSIFGYGALEIAIPSMLNREHELQVYGGWGYITVEGPKKPGIYMGYNMTDLYTIKYGGERGMEPYRGEEPPPTFAEWVVDLPELPQAARAAQPAGPTAGDAAGAVAASDAALKVLNVREDVYRYEEGLAADWKAGEATLSATMGGAPRGWAFVGIETVGLAEVPLRIETSGDLAARNPDSFAGLVVDYHTPRGYSKRVFFGLGAVDPDRIDLRAGDWYLDDASFSLPQRVNFLREYRDLSGALSGGRGEIMLEIARYAPAEWDGRTWLAAGVQEVGPDASVEAELLDAAPYVPNPEIASLEALEGMEDDFLVIRNDTFVLAVSRVNGAMCGLWHAPTGRRLVGECADEYRFESFTSIAAGQETLDEVQAIRAIDSPEGPSVEAICTTPLRPDVSIRKLYLLAAGGQVHKSCRFATTDSEGFFLRWDCRTRIADSFAADGLRGTGFAPATRVAEGKVVAADDAAPAEQAGMDLPPIQTFKDRSLCLAGFRYKVNGRFVLRREHEYLSDGWTVKVFTDYVRFGSSVGGQARWAAVAGDPVDFLQYYKDLPEVQEIYELPPPPQWVRELVGDVMTMHPRRAPFLLKIAPEPATATLWLHTAWGNWGPHHVPLAILDANADWDPVKRYEAFHRSFPNTKFSHYHNFLFSEHSEVAHKYPEFGVRDRNGDLISAGRSNRRGMTTFFFQMADRHVRQFMLEWLREKMRHWDMDFLYFDGPGSEAEVIDWGRRDVAQGYDWIELYRGIYQICKQVGGEEGIFFVNGRAPFARIGYIEFRKLQWQVLANGQWRPLAYRLLSDKVTEPAGFLIVPTYGTPEADPALAAYTVFYGWGGNRAVKQRLPWMLSAREFRFMRIVPDAVKPRWWRDGTQDYEAAGFRKNAAAIVNLLGHDPQGNRDVEIEIDARKLGLTPGEPVHAVLRMMIDATPEKNADGEVVAKYKIGQDAKAYTDEVLFRGRECPETLRLTLPLRHMRVTSVILSHEDDPVAAMAKRNGETAD
jgi:hypothetical protein